MKNYIFKEKAAVSEDIVFEVPKVGGRIMISL